jgi:V/A-type H+-transporting ATPase subunit C
LRGDVLVIGSKYAYSFGRIRALEADLIDASQFKRMMEAPTAKEAAKVLSETIYAGIGELQDTTTLEQVLQEELEVLYDLVQHISPQKEITDLIQMKYDFYNVKVLLKAEVTSREPIELTSLGVIDLEKLKKALQERLKDLPSVLAQAVEKARILYEETGDIQDIDFALDSAYAHALVGHMKDFPFLREFFRLKIDLENIRNMLRSQKYNIDVARVYLEGSTIDVKTLQRLQGESVETVISTFQTRDYRSVVEEGLKAYEEEKSLTVYQKLMDDFLMERLKAAKMVVFGIEPLVGYILAKEHEVKLIRLILIGKLKGVNVIKRMSDSYV